MQSRRNLLEGCGARRPNIIYGRPDILNSPFDLGQLDSSTGQRSLPGYEVGLPAVPAELLASGFPRNPASSPGQDCRCVRSGRYAACRSARQLLGVSPDQRRKARVKALASEYDRAAAI
jgi:hypothetical protein